MRRYQGSDSLLEEFLGLSTGWIIALAALLAAVPAIVIAIAWIWD